MPQVPSIPNPFGLFRERPEANDVSPLEAHVHLVLQLDTVPSQQALEDASLRALELVEARAGDIALEPVSSCNFATGEIELDFTVQVERSSALHEKLGRIARLLEREFPQAHERSSETEATRTLPVATVPA